MGIHVTSQAHVQTAPGGFSSAGAASLAEYYEQEQDDTDDVLDKHHHIDDVDHSKPPLEREVFDRSLTRSTLKQGESVNTTVANIAVPQHIDLSALNAQAADVFARYYGDPSLFTTPSHRSDVRISRSHQEPSKLLTAAKLTPPLSPQHQALDQAFRHATTSPLRPSHDIPAKAPNAPYIPSLRSQDRVVFRVVRGNAAKQLGFDQLTYRDFERLVRGEIWKNSPEGGELISAPRTNGYRKLIDWDAVDRITPTLQRQLGINETEARYRARSLPDVQIKQLQYRDPPTTFAPKETIDMLVTQFRNEGMDADSALLRAKNQAQIPIVYDESIRPKLEVDSTRVRILQEHFQREFGYPEHVARSLAQQDERSRRPVDTQPVIERDAHLATLLTDAYAAPSLSDEAARARVEMHQSEGLSDDAADALFHALTSRNIPCVEALKRAHWHPAVLKRARVAPPQTDLHWAPDKALIRKRVEALLKSERGKDELERISYDFVQNGQTRDDAQARAEQQLRTLLTEHFAQDPRCMTRQQTAHLANLGIDITFSTDKETSMLLIALSKAGRDSEAQEIISIWKDVAGAAAAEVIEAHAKVVRVVTENKSKAESTLGSATQRSVANLIIGQTVQFAARPTEASDKREYKVDPHLHMHNFVGPQGVVVDPETGELRSYSIDEHGIKVALKDMAHVVNARFQRELAEKLGVQFTQRRDADGVMHTTIAGVNKLAVDHFSTGRDRVLELQSQLENEMGPVTPETLQQEAKRTRIKKSAAAKRLDAAYHPEAWIHELDSLGIEPVDLSAAMGAPMQLADYKTRAAHLAQRLDGPLGITKDAAVVDEDELFSHILRCNDALAEANEPQSLTFPELKRFQQEFIRGLVHVQRHDAPESEPIPCFVTYSQLKREAEIVTTWERLGRRELPSVPDEILQRAIHQYEVEHGYALDDEQVLAARTLVSGAGITGVTGDAGTGKTTPVAVAVEALRQANLVDNVYVLSVAGLRSLDTSEHIPDSRHYNFNSAPRAKPFAHPDRLPTDRDLVIIDEAAFVDTERWNAMLGWSNELGRSRIGDARIIATYDDQQLTPIGSGGLHAILDKSIVAERLQHIHRMNDVDGVNANAQSLHEQRLFRNGHIADGLASLYARGRLHIARDTTEQRRMVLERYRELLHGTVSRFENPVPAQDVLVVVDSSNHTVDAVNRDLQRIRAEMGLITGDPYRVTATDSGRSWSLHVGDDIMAAAPLYTVARKRIENGQKGAILDIDRENELVTIRLSDGTKHTVAVPKEAPTQHLALSAAQSCAKSQGGQARVVLWASGHTNQAKAYVSATRATELTEGFTVDTSDAAMPAEHFRDLEEQWMRDNANPSALHALGDTDPDARDRLLAQARRHDPGASTHVVDIRPSGDVSALSLPSKPVSLNRTVSPTPVLVPESTRVQKRANTSPPTPASPTTVQGQRIRAKHVNASPVNTSDTEGITPNAQTPAKPTSNSHPLSIPKKQPGDCEVSAQPQGMEQDLSLSPPSS